MYLYTKSANIVNVKWYRSFCTTHVYIPICLERFDTDSNYKISGGWLLSEGHKTDGLSSKGHIVLFWIILLYLICYCL